MLALILPIHSCLSSSELACKEDEEEDMNRRSGIRVWWPHLHAVVEVPPFHDLVVCPLCLAGLNECACS